MAANFMGHGSFFMARCPLCLMENYGPAVATGQCSWCGATATSALREWEARVKGTEINDTDTLADFMKMTQSDLTELLNSLDVFCGSADRGG